MTAAARCQMLVFWLVGNATGLNKTEQVYKAAEAIGWHNCDKDLAKIKRGFQGRAGAITLHEIEARLDQSVEYRVHQAIEAMNATDPEFYAEHMEMLRSSIRPANHPSGNEGGQT